MKQKRISGKKPNRVRMAELFPMGETVVIYGESCVTVRGCRRILAYSPSEICLQMKKRSLTVRGEALICLSFSGGCTTLQGRIFAVESTGGERT